MPEGRQHGLRNGSRPPASRGALQDDVLNLGGGRVPRGISYGAFTIGLEKRRAPFRRRAARRRFRPGSRRFDARHHGPRIGRPRWRSAWLPDLRTVCREPSPVPHRPRTGNCAPQGLDHRRTLGARVRGERCRDLDAHGPRGAGFRGDCGARGCDNCYARTREGREDLGSVSVRGAEAARDRGYRGTAWCGGALRWIKARSRADGKVPPSG